VEAGTNASTVALLAVGGDEMEPSAWGHNRVTLFLGEINTGTWPCRLVSLESETVKCGHIPRDSGLRMTALARVGSNSKRQTHPLVREDFIQGL
jgi:hypothetical protein